MKNADRVEASTKAALTEPLYGPDGAEAADEAVLWLEDLKSGALGSISAKRAELQAQLPSDDGQPQRGIASVIGGFFSGRKEPVKDLIKWYEELWQDEKKRRIVTYLLALTVAEDVIVDLRTFIVKVNRERPRVAAVIGQATQAARTAARTASAHFKRVHDGAPADSFEEVVARYSDPAAHIIPQHRVVEIVISVLEETEGDPEANVPELIVARLSEASLRELAVPDGSRAVIQSLAEAHGAGPQQADACLVETLHENIRIAPVMPHTGAGSSKLYQTLPVGSPSLVWQAGQPLEVSPYLHDRRGPGMIRIDGNLELDDFTGFREVSPTPVAARWRSPAVPSRSRGHSGRTSGRAAGSCCRQRSGPTPRPWQRPGPGHRAWQHFQRGPGQLGFAVGHAPELSQFGARRLTEGIFQTICVRKFPNQHK